jgi:two-component system response regulator HydG/two-component system response regulator AtoC
MTSILVAEDDEDIRFLVEEVLLDAGYEVDTAETVAGAMSRLETQGYDLLLTDGRLPDGTGLSIAERANRTGTKVLIFTGYVHEFPPEQLARYEVVTKPADLDYLVERVAHLIAA